MTTQPTPTPWKASGHKTVLRGPGFQTVTYIGRGAEIIAQCWTPENGDTDQLLANAAIIERAVNSHADLVNALARVKFALSGPVGENFAALIPDTVKAIDAALAKAKGDAP